MVFQQALLDLHKSCGWGSLDNPITVTTTTKPMRVTLLAQGLLTPVLWDWAKCSAYYVYLCVLLFHMRAYEKYHIHTYTRAAAETPPPLASSSPSPYCHYDVFTLWLDDHVALRMAWLKSCHCELSRLTEIPWHPKHCSPAAESPAELLDWAGHELFQTGDDWDKNG